MADAFQILCARHFYMYMEKQFVIFKQSWWACVTIKSERRTLKMLSLQQRSAQVAHKDPVSRLQACITDSQLTVFSFSFRWKSQKAAITCSIGRVEQRRSPLYDRVTRTQRFKKGWWPLVCDKNIITWFNKDRKISRVFQILQGREREPTFAAGDHYFLGMHFRTNQSGEWRISPSTSTVQEKAGIEHRWKSCTFENS